MADTRTPAQRRRIMAAVKSKNTRPEIALRRALHADGIRGWRTHYKGASGTPDLAWPALGVAVFVDGAFWHGHPSRHRPGRSGEFWDSKIAGNVERDREVDARLVAAGWSVIRVWDFEVGKEMDTVLRRLREALRERIAHAPIAEWQRRLQQQGDGDSQSRG